jgi:uncharacterized protein (DUF488 family)
VSRLATIGVYGFDAPTFTEALHGAGIRLVADVRQRRGVRGREYAWANSQRLQALLDDAGIGYRHLPELAPTTELRRLQYAEDARQGVGKRSREVLAPAYAEGYTREILDPVDLPPIAAALEAGGPAALLCVERDPQACHRLLVAERLSGRFGFEVTHLLPIG